MPPTVWTSSYLLSYVKRLTGRTGTDSITDAQWYTRISEAAMEVYTDIAAICPHVLYPTAPYDSLPTLTVAADLQTATFGTDALGYAEFPMGKGGVFASLDDIPNSPLIPGQDYMNEGTQIRALNNGTLPATLYWYGVAQPDVIDASTEPTLLPEGARELYGIRAAYNFGTEGNRNVALSQTMATRYGYPLVAAPGRFAFWCQVFKTQFAGGNPVISVTGRQLAIGGQWGYGGYRNQWAT